MKELIAVIEDAMRPLVTRFGLHVIRRDDGRHYAAVLYVNATTGLKVAVEWMESRPFLTIYELEDGQIVDENPPIHPGNERWKAFDVDGLLLIRPVDNSPVGKMFSRGDLKVVSRLLKRYADALTEQGDDVLTGNFQVFQQLKELVMTRARELDKLN
ncbi:MAG: hypothetical protein LBG44_07195 [Gemmatimonadota bacterium]|jgi:hypothetical protein|nr:hypothetical protein [Gemmatimonadota bacterium]